MAHEQERCHYRPIRHSVRRRHLQTDHALRRAIPEQASRSQVHQHHVPPERLCYRRALLGHPAEQMESYLRRRCHLDEHPEVSHTRIRRRNERSNADGHAVFSTTPTPAPPPMWRHRTCTRTTARSTPREYVRRWRRAGTTRQQLHNVTSSLHNTSHQQGCCFARGDGTSGVSWAIFSGQDMACLSHFPCNDSARRLERRRYGIFMSLHACMLVWPSNGLDEIYIHSNMN